MEVCWLFVDSRSKTAHEVGFLGQLVLSDKDCV